MELPARAYGTIGRCQNSHRHVSIQRLPIGQLVPAAPLSFSGCHQAHRSGGRIGVVQVIGPFVVATWPIY
jgi:hypothetical protein